MSIPKFHKLYFPGLISLVFLPLMCIWYLISNNTFQQYGVVDIAWTSKKELNAFVNKWASIYHKKFNVETFRKYNQIKIIGNVKLDAVAFGRLENSFNQLAAKNDTINGIKLTFGNHASYGELIKALDICLRDDDPGLFLAPTINEIFIARNGIPKPKLAMPKKSNLANDKTFTIDDVTYYKPKPPVISMQEKISSGINFIFKILFEFWPSGIILLLMLWFIFSKKNRYLNLKTFRFVKQ